jgi:hypothetical protein
MKKSRGPIAVIILCLLFSTASYAKKKELPPALAAFAAEKVSSVLAPLSRERIVILTGEKGTAAVGLKDGVIKGDVGQVAAGLDQAAEGTYVGQCAVTKAAISSSICEVITLKREVEGGDTIFFDRVRYSDPDVYPPAITMLSEIVEPYEPYKQLRVMIYGIFDEGNQVTGFSQGLRNELVSIFSQKKRIHVISSGEFKDFVFYPGAGPEVLEFAKTKMKKANIDVLLFGNYRSNGQTVNLSMTRLNLDGGPKTSVFSLPQAKYAESLARVAVPAKEQTQVLTYPCSIFVKGNTARFDKANEKALVIKREADGNAFTTSALKKSDFNIISPVDVKIRIDGALVLQGLVDRLTVPISAGTHQIVISFRRGYFFDEAPVYTSKKEVVKEIGLDLRQTRNLSMSVDLDPLFDRNNIGVRIVENAGKQKQMIEPIPKIQSDRTVEVFKD